MRNVWPGVAARQSGGCVTDSRHPLRRRAPVLLVERSSHERRDDQRQLAVEVVGQTPALRQLVRRQLRNQVLEGAPVAVDTEVGQRSGRQEPPQQVERLRTRRRLPRTVSLALLLWIALADRQGRRLDWAAIDLEPRI